MSVLDLVGSILTELEKVHEKLDELLTSKSDWSTKEHMIVDLKNAEEIIKRDPENFPIPSIDLVKGKEWADKLEKATSGEPTVIEKTIVKGGITIPKKGQGKYEWFKVKGLDKVKVRKCSNAGCPYYLKYSEEKGKYEHWKYDPNTGEGGFVQDKCEYYLTEGF